MAFNTLSFFVFFLCFFTFYWSIASRSLGCQNVAVLLGSFIFYAFWDIRFLTLLVASIAITYLLSKKISSNASVSRQRLWLCLGVFQAVGFLVLFKYFNFFIDGFQNLTASLGLDTNVSSLNIILPLGISFYTFRNLGYLFELRSRKCSPATGWLTFFSYVSFFPSLVSGPVDKPSILIPQFERLRILKPNEVYDGVCQICWGLFKKNIIADNCAVTTDVIFENYQTLPSSTLLLGAFLYTIQIYADFSGYSDIAIGLAKLLGFQTTRNFDNPLFSRNIVEFWRRWHISLSTWFTEHLFIPLTIALRRLGKCGLVVSVFITFAIIGIWHGPEMKFLAFGVVHACLFLPVVLRKRGMVRRSEDLANFVKNFRVAVSVFVTFFAVMLSFVIFKANDISMAIEYIFRMFYTNLNVFPSQKISVREIVCLLLAMFLLIFEWLNLGKGNAVADLTRPWPGFAKVMMLYFFVFLIFILSSSTRNFIYFQF